MIDMEKVIKGLRCHVYGHPHTRCHDCPYWGTGKHGCSECNVLASDALALLQSQPQIVRCNDCRFYLGNGYCNRSGIHLEVNDDWYCADGEKRT